MPTSLLTGLPIVESLRRSTRPESRSRRVNESRPPVAGAPSPQQRPHPPPAGTSERRRERHGLLLRHRGTKVDASSNSIHIHVMNYKEHYHISNAQ